MYHFSISQNYNTTRFALVGTNYNSKNKPPVRSGRLKSIEFTRRGKSSVRAAAEYIQHIAYKQSWGRINGVFLTLTYADNMQDFEQAKIDLNIFLTKLRKRYKKLVYVWVIELQKRGAIHFHLVLNHQIPIKTLNKFWYHGASNIQYIKKSAANYIGCYMGKAETPIEGKRYGMSTSVLQEIRYKTVISYEIPYINVNEVYDNLIQLDFTVKETTIYKYLKTNYLSDWKPLYDLQKLINNICELKYMIN